VSHHSDDWAGWVSRENLRPSIVRTVWRTIDRSGSRLDLDRHELVSRHLGHCPEDSLVQRSLAKLGGDVFGYRPDCRNHLLPLFLKKFCVHETLITARSKAQLSSLSSRPREILN
jgi:hypothetical protein